jgi:RNA polymerase sigma-70 factor, ECF subfamily
LRFKPSLARRANIYKKNSQRFRRFNLFIRLLLQEIGRAAWDAMGTQDADWMERWRRGDAAAFEAIVERWRRPVARFLFRYGGRADLVQDQCQEVFLRVFQSGPRYRETGTFPGWLFRIALNVARDGGRRRRDPAPLAEADPVDPATPVEMVCRRRELANMMARAAAELPELLRIVLALRHDEDLSFEEIARLTGAPASTVKSRFAAALTRLRARLEQFGYGPEEITP